MLVLVLLRIPHPLVHGHRNVLQLKCSQHNNIVTVIITVLSS